MSRRILVLLALPMLVAMTSVSLWDPAHDVPHSAETTPLDNVRFAVIKPFEPARDGYRWLHGVALAWHQGKLYASYGVNTGSENTDTERVQIRVSADGGFKWSDMAEIAGGAGQFAISHGVFGSRDGKLYAFFGSFNGFRERVHMRGYRLNDETQSWEPIGVLARDGFWPMGSPIKGSEERWLIPGIAVTAPIGEPGNPAAVAISRDDDFTEWEVVTIPRPDDLTMWGESTVIENGSELTCIARWQGKSPYALVSLSHDGGTTWSPLAPSNMPMAASKPFAGVLSTGQRFLICTTTADSGNRRSPLTIAVSRPEETLFSKVYRIRDAKDDGPGESNPNAALSYPYAVEHQGFLYVGYSNDGGRGHNANSAELAIIPVSSLDVP